AKPETIFSSLSFLLMASPRVRREVAIRRNSHEEVVVPRTVGSRVEADGVALDRGGTRRYGGRRGFACSIAVGKEHPVGDVGRLEAELGAKAKCNHHVAA